MLSNLATILNCGPFYLKKFSYNKRITKDMVECVMGMNFEIRGLHIKLDSGVAPKNLAALDR